jgi:hypothetical protein
VCTDAFEAEANVDAETLALAKNIRADVAENRAIMEALHQRLLEETREEAAAASGSTRLGYLMLHMDNAYTIRCGLLSFDRSICRPAWMF